jgi:hypothetical protein
MYKKTICIDFDGVIHSYTSGWQGANVISDPPVTGAFAALTMYCRHYKVVIFSTRSSDLHGRFAMMNWFLDYGWPRDENDRPKNLIFTKTKPPAWITIDDRGITFTGKFPTIEEIENFKPWYKKLKE